MVDADSAAFHPDLRRARFLPRTSVTRGNRRLLRGIGGLTRRQPPPGGELVELANKVTLRVHLPHDDSRAARDHRRRPAVLFVHGGGFMIGSAAQGDRLCRRIADELGAIAVSLDYRLPPEHPYPAPLDDAEAALRWLAAEPDVDPARIVVIGESAGGGLAASLALRVHDRGDIALAGQVLAYPMVDDRTGPSAAAHPHLLRLWNARSNQLGWGMYLGAGERGPTATPLSTDELIHAVPARRVENDLTARAGLPPTWIGVGSLDLFHDECREYARLLSEAGVACELLVVSGAYHGFATAEPAAEVSRDFVQRQVDAVRRMTAHT